MNSFQFCSQIISPVILKNSRDGRTKIEFTISIETRNGTIRFPVVGHAELADSLSHLVEGDWICATGRLESSVAGGLVVLLKDAFRLEPNTHSELVEHI